MTSARQIEPQPRKDPYGTPTDAGSPDGVNPKSIRMHQDNLLICPTCGYETLHQTAVEVHARQGDGETTVVRVNFTTGQVTNRKKHQNPPDSAQGMLIEFECSNCSQIDEECQNCSLPHEPTPDLGIWHRRGATIIEWVQDQKTDQT